MTRTAIPPASRSARRQGPPAAAAGAAAGRAATPGASAVGLASVRSTAAWRVPRPRTSGWGVVVLLLAGVGPSSRPAGAWADDGPSATPAAATESTPRTSRTSRAKAGGADAGAQTRAAREQRVLAFVTEHNPDLAAVLGNLARRQPQEYDAALDDLDRTVSKLAGTRSKDPELHAIELEVWQTKTRVEMLVAQLMAGATKNRTALEARLREALAAELEAKAAHLGYRRQRSMAWYDRQIDRIRAERDDMVETRMKSLLKDSAAKRGEQAANRDEQATKTQAPATGR
jgi:hypothetical protein